jgi:tetratricopeptide (TPR) repeat protein
MPAPAVPAQAAPPVEAGLTADQYYQKGRELAYQRKTAEAIALLSEAIKLRPANPVYWNTRGFANFLAGRNAEALTDLDEAIRLNPKYGNAYRNRSVVKARTGDKAGSEADAAKAKEFSQ